VLYILKYWCNIVILIEWREIIIQKNTQHSFKLILKYLQDFDNITNLLIISFKKYI